jgi:adenine phosphoribosyltransferase (EC 2.4.2.7)
VPIRKKGKLPFDTVSEEYELEYGSATVEIHTDAVRPGDCVLLIDDLIATGGTMMAGKRLLEKLGASVIEGAAIVDLPELGGSAAARCRPAAVHPGGFRRDIDGAAADQKLARFAARTAVRGGPVATPTAQAQQAAVAPEVSIRSVDSIALQGATAILDLTLNIRNTGGWPCRCRNCGFRSSSTAWTWRRA